MKTLRQLASLSRIPTDEDLAAARALAEIAGTNEARRLLKSVEQRHRFGSTSNPDRRLFFTITSYDWRRSMTSARKQKNVVSEQIRAEEKRRGLVRLSPCQA